MVIDAFQTSVGNKPTQLRAANLHGVQDRWTRLDIYLSSYLRSDTERASSNWSSCERLPQVMEAVVLRQYGGFERLRLEEVPLPEVGAGEILIRNRAVGVNHCDTDVRRGAFGVAQTFPHVMGVDAAGEVVAVGSDVAGFAQGDRVAPHFLLSCGTCRNCIAGRENMCLRAGVLGVTTWGTYAQFVKVRANNAVHLPDALSYVEAVAAQVPFATAWEALIEVGRLQAGETALVNAAGSGVGSAGVQVAKLAGARVIATTGSDEKFTAARELGADEVINYESTNVGNAVTRLTDGLGVDLALDVVGGNRLLDCIAAVSQGGRIVSVGAHAGERVEIDMIDLFRKHVSLHGCGRSTRAIVAKVLALVAAGRLRPVIAANYALADAPAAHRLMESRKFFGRIVMDPWTPA
jgi:NADPH:quinone reductase-like Zn-dependent oxidoreductase